MSSLNSLWYYWKKESDHNIVTSRWNNHILWNLDFPSQKPPPILASDCPSLCSKWNCRNKLYLSFCDIPKCHFSQGTKNPKAAFCVTPGAGLLEIQAASCSSCFNQEARKRNTLITTGYDPRRFARVCEILVILSQTFQNTTRCKHIILGSNLKIKQ